MLLFGTVLLVLRIQSNKLDRSCHFESGTFLNRCHGSDVYLEMSLIPDTDRNVPDKFLCAQHFYTLSI